MYLLSELFRGMIILRKEYGLKEKKKSWNQTKTQNKRMNSTTNLEYSLIRQEHIQ